MEIGEWKKSQELFKYYEIQKVSFGSMFTLENMSAEGERNTTMKNKPVHINQILSLPVDRFGSQGDPMFLHNNFIIILKSNDKIKVNVNEFMKIRITKILDKFALADLVQE